MINIHMPFGLVNKSRSWNASHLVTILCRNWIINNHENLNEEFLMQKRLHRAFKSLLMVMSVDGFFFSARARGSVDLFSNFTAPKKPLPITSSSTMADWFPKLYVLFIRNEKVSKNKSLISWLLINRWTLSITKTKDGQIEKWRHLVSRRKYMTHALDVPLKSMAIAIVITSQCL